ncbi:MAG: hypothetical protein Solivirus1_30 [Solivirus sp.]|uniref:Uncharacterized protein n=1 Tax=Solivirus sp. TaxID=2487772 RepID=A0A3G5AJ98_9VIRU|nr:MAG: hypothetical protein Solivirus1_30 [Solivirus sp.]
MSFADTLDKARKFIDQKRASDIREEALRIETFREKIKTDILNRAQQGLNSLMYESTDKTVYTIPIEIQKEMEDAGCTINYRSENKPRRDSYGEHDCTIYKTIITWT